MSVSSVYNNQYNLSQALNEYISNKSESLFGSSTSTSSSAAKQAYGASINSAEGMAAMQRALNEIEPDKSGKITFRMIDQYRQEQEEIFTNTLKTALEKSGVDPEVKFSMVATSDGQIEIKCDNPEEKAKIEKFFEENPAMKEEFLQLQALANMGRARNSAVASGALSQAKAATFAFQAQALEAFFSESFSSGMGYSSLMGDFGSDYANYYLGANYTV